jgi:hypothetical protein
MSLRSKIIRLAASNPDLQPHLLPLVKSAMDFDTKEQMDKYLKDHPGADRSNHHVKKNEGGGASAPKGKPFGQHHDKFVKHRTKSLRSESNPSEDDEKADSISSKIRSLDHHDKDKVEAEEAKHADWAWDYMLGVVDDAEKSFKDFDALVKEAEGVAESKWDKDDVRQAKEALDGLKETVKHHHKVDSKSKRPTTFALEIARSIKGLYGHVTHHLNEIHGRHSKE